ncbi:MAG TPA: sugar ABC transporter substrate-binding protein [Roseiarcus sp.]
MCSTIARIEDGFIEAFSAALGDIAIEQSNLFQSNLSDKSYLAGDMNSAARRKGMTTRKWALLGAAMFVAAPACAADSFTMGYSAGYLTDPFQSIEVNMTIDAAKKAGLTALPVANANGDAGRQVTDIHNLIAAGAQGIIVVPTDSNAVAPAVDFASQKKVPVVSIDNGVAGGKVFMVVRSNSVQMGKEACEAVGKALGGKGVVLELQGDLATTAGRERTNGFESCMKSEFSSIKVNSQPTNWKTEKAVAAAQTIVSSTPDLGAIYMQSDSVMLAGVLSVLKGADKMTKVGENKHIFLVTIDGTPGALKQVRDGYVDAVISQPVDLYVKYGLYYLQAAVAGKTFSAGPTDHNSEIVSDQGSLQDLLPAPVVTSANAGDSALWGNAAK